MKRIITTLLAGLLVMVPAWAQSAFPAPNSTTENRRPNIGFDFAQPVRNMQLFIDGRDFTGASNKNGNVINIQLNYDAELGNHQVQARAINLLGLPVGSTWNFTIAAPQSSPTNPSNPFNGQTQVTPQQDTTVAELRPRVAATYPETLRNAKVWLDGAEVTSQVSLQGGSLSFTPGQDLAAGRHQVATQVTSVSGRTYSHSWSFEVRPPAPPTQSTPAFSNLSPPPGASVRNLRPFISGDFPAGLTDVRLIVDNTDLTPQCQRTANRLSFSPVYDLQTGNHNARIEGRMNNGQIVATDWNFIVEGSPQTNPTPEPPVSLDFGVEEPETGDRVRPNFNIIGQAPAGHTVRVSVKPMPKKNKVSQFQAKVDSSGNFLVPIKSPAWAVKGTRLELTVTVLNDKGRRVADPIVVEVYRK